MSRKLDLSAINALSSFLTGVLTLPSELTPFVLVVASDFVEWVPTHVILVIVVALTVVRPMLSSTFDYAIVKRWFGMHTFSVNVAKLELLSTYYRLCPTRWTDVRGVRAADMFGSLPTQGRVTFPGGEVADALMHIEYKSTRYPEGVVEREVITYTLTFKFRVEYAALEKALEDELEIAQQDTALITLFSSILIFSDSGDSPGWNGLNHRRIFQGSRDALREFSRIALDGYFSNAKSTIQALIAGYLNRSPHILQDHKLSLCLAGPRGSGKTSLVRRVASALGYNVHFVDLSGCTTYIALMHLGVRMGTRHLYVFDEVHQVIRSMHKNPPRQSALDPPTIDDLLNFFQGAILWRDIAFIACTERFDECLELAPSLFRAGRFQPVHIDNFAETEINQVSQYYFGKPCESASEIVHKKLANSAITNAAQDALADDDKDAAYRHWIDQLK